MKNFSPSKFRALISRVVFSLPLFAGGLFLGLAAIGVIPTKSANAQAARQNEDFVSEVITEPHFATGPIYTQVPTLTPDQLRMREEELKEVNKLPPLPGEPRNTEPTDPATAPRDDSYLTSSRSGQSPNAPNDFISKRVHDLPSSEASSSQSVINESSVGNMGDTVFFTGNWYAARSGNGGQTFTYVDPTTTFPSVNNGFCCDQVANYAPNQNMMIWALQYSKDASSGTLRIARAVGSAAVISNSWVDYDFNPQDLGFSSGNWMDFPNLTVSDNYLFVTSNVYATADDSFAGAVILRISLSELSAGGTLHSKYFKVTDTNSLRCAEGAHTTIYCGTHLSTTQVRIYRWDDSSSSVSWDDVAINSFNPLRRGDGVAVSPDGTNWAARADDRVLGSWVSNGVIGLMWAAKQGGSFPFPYTIIARFSESNRSLLSQNALWSNETAWLYPTASVNASGNLAGLVSFGGGSYYPGANLWISDDIESGFNPLRLHAATTSAAGPSSNAWGDFQTVRQHKDYKNTWVASTHYIQSSSNNVVPRYLWVGRERDFSVSVKADFNGDGTSDIVWQNKSTGQRYLWPMSGGQHAGNVDLGNVSTDWDIVGTGDFNGDGQVDILWQNHNSGQRYLWLFIGAQHTGNVDLGVVSTDWDIVGTGDFNGDGQVDILWQNRNSGQRYLWLFTGTQHTGNVNLGVVSTDWDIVGTGDFNGDGQVDIVWQNRNSGQRYLWPMTGTQHTGNVDLGVVSTDWDIAGIGDFDADGQADILWQNHNTGQRYLWPMTGTQHTGNVDLGYVSTDWSIRNH